MVVGIGPVAGEGDGPAARVIERVPARLGPGLAFRGGNGSCVIDDYVTRVRSHHYREIACIAQGKTTTSVIVASALASRWTQYAPELEHAVAAWEVR